MWTEIRLDVQNGLISFVSFFLSVLLAFHQSLLNNKTTKQLLCILLQFKKIFHSFLSELNNQLLLFTVNLFYIGVVFSLKLLQVKFCIKHLSPCQAKFDILLFTQWLKYPHGIFHQLVRLLFFVIIFALTAFCFSFLVRHLLLIQMYSHGFRFLKWRFYKIKFVCQ